MTDMNNDATFDEQTAKVCNAILDKCSSQGFDALTSTERVIYCANVFWIEVEMGGFIQCFYNEIGDHWQEVIESLKAISAHAQADVLEQVGTLFNDGIVPPDAESRWEQWLNFPQSTQKRLNEFEHLLYQPEQGGFDLIAAYIAQHKSALRVGSKSE